MPPPASSVRFLAVCLGLVGCTGAIGDAPAGPSAAPSPPGDLLGDELPAINDAHGLRLLTRREYVHAVAELTGVRVPPASVPLPTVVAGHGAISRRQELVRDELRAYAGLALEVGAQAASLTGCTDRACAEDHLLGFLDAAHREPTDDARRAEALATLDAPDAGATLPERLGTAIAVALASPSFLYRREIGAGSEPGAVRLTDAEVASRLAFLLWESGPDASLRAAAGAGQLRTSAGRLVQLARLLDDPRARIGMRGFVRDWLGLTDPHGGLESKNPEVLEGLPGDLASRAEESLDRTVDAVLFEGAGSFTALLDTGSYVVDDALAALLELGDGPEGFAARQLGERAGLLLHPAVLAAHTAEGGASPFPVGRFVYEQVLCGTLGDIPMLPEVDAADLEDQTLREYLETLTAPAACQSCHAKIGPPGFAFLAFDPIGRATPDDPLGRAFDTSGRVELPSGPLVFDDAAGLSRALATHPDVSRCIARRLFRWTYGHFEGAADRDHVAALESVALATGADMRALLETLVASDSFVLRRGEP